jgi:voltage-gated potassium channel
VSAIFDVTLGPLAVITLVLIVVELLLSLRPPWNVVVYTAQLAIWAFFLAAFVLELWLAPDKLRYVRKNALLVLALAIPALRIFRAAHALRILRASRVVRSLNVARSITSLNRGLAAIREFLDFSQIALVVAVTAIVWLVATGLVYYLEQTTGSGLGGVGEAMWWSASILTTVGISREPESLEGRAVAVILRVFGVAVVGYVTARMAAYFLGGRREANSNEELRLLREDITALRRELSANRKPSDVPRQEGQERRTG